MTQEELASALAALTGKVTDEPLADGGRYFGDSCSDYAQCGHSETGNPQNRHDGELVELLWNGYRDGVIGILEDNGETSAEVASIAGDLADISGEELWKRVHAGHFQARDRDHVDACDALAAKIRTVAASNLRQHQ